MKLFSDRHKTLLPRVDNIYAMTRLLVFFAIVWYTLVEKDPETDPILFYVILGTYLIHFFVFVAAVKNLFDIKLAYFSAIIYDLIFIPLLVMYSGGVDSTFYMLFFLVISVASYVLTFWFSITATTLVSLLYIAAISFSFSFDRFFDVTMRISFIWIYHFAIMYAADYMRKSEKRLLNLFNTLNMRTAELEKSQAQLEMIYENTRILGSLLDTDSIVEEVTRLTGRVLQYDSSAVVFMDRDQNYYYRARFNRGQPNNHPKAIDKNKNGLMSKVFKMGEAVSVKDASNRDDYTVLDEKAKSVMIVPLTTHAKTTGCLVAESYKKDNFTERDEKMLMAIARSAALALENALLHKRTEELTMIDDLTGTYNYRYFVRKLQEEKRRAARYNLPLSLIMVDIDWFKKINDSYGHEAGNVVLKQLSAIIKECIRDVDIFARYGGEEFAVILPQTPQKDALAIGERIRTRVEEETIETEPGRIKITVSVGLSSYPENGHSEEELVSIADQALYRAKGEGRNLVCVK